MKETLLLFDEEMDKLKDTGWEHEILYENGEGIFLVKVDIPDNVMKKVNRGD